jgi:hypothetical protein
MIRQLQHIMKDVVVVNYDGDNVALLLPLWDSSGFPHEEGGKQTYVNLLSGNVWNDGSLYNAAWIIRPGDRAQFNGDFTGIYRGIKISLDHIIYLSDGDSGIKIQPVPVAPTPDPEKDLRERIEAAERFLNLAKNALNEKTKE